MSRSPRHASEGNRDVRLLGGSRQVIASLLVASLGLGVCALALAGHRPPNEPPSGPPSGPSDPGGGGHDGGGGGEGLPPTTPSDGVGGMMKRLEMLAIADQFPPAAVAAFEGLYFGWIEFNASNDRFMPFDEWLWANGVEDPEEFEMFMALYLLLVKVGG